MSILFFRNGVLVQSLQGAAARPFHSIGVMCIVVCLLVEIVRAVPFQSSCGTGRKGETSRRTPVVGQQNGTIHAVHGTQSEKRGGIGSVVKQIDVFFVGQRGQPAQVLVCIVLLPHCTSHRFHIRCLLSHHPPRCTDVRQSAKCMRMPDTAGCLVRTAPADPLH